MSDSLVERLRSWASHSGLPIGAGNLLRAAADQIEADAARIDLLQVALKCCLDSANPHPLEHQAMCKAWKLGKSVLAKIEAQEVG